MGHRSGKRAATLKMFLKKLRDHEEDLVKDVRAHIWSPRTASGVMPELQQQPNGPLGFAVTIPKTTTAIDAHAFEFSTSVCFVKMPSDNAFALTSIGSHAFYGCTSLLEVRMAQTLTLTDIGAFTFYGCAALVDVTLPPHLRKIKAYTFSGCTSLRKIQLPAGLENIGLQAFKDCNSLSGIVLPAAVTVIGEKAFENCPSLREFKLPPDTILKTIENGAFYGCTALLEIWLPHSLVVLGAEAFRSCTSLREISLPAGVVVTRDAFQGSPGTPRRYPKRRRCTNADETEPPPTKPLMTPTTSSSGPSESEGPRVPFPTDRPRTHRNAFG